MNGTSLNQQIPSSSKPVMLVWIVIIVVAILAAGVVYYVLVSPGEEVRMINGEKDGLGVAPQDEQEVLQELGTLSEGSSVEEIEQDISETNPGVLDAELRQIDQ